MANLKAAGKRQAALDSARDFATRVLDEDYEEKLRLRLLAGEAPAQIEALMLHYKYGKPVEQVIIRDEADFSDLTDAELAALLSDTEKSIDGASEDASGTTNSETPGAIH